MCVTQMAQLVDLKCDSVGILDHWTVISIKLCCNTNDGRLAIL